MQWQLQKVESLPLATFVVKAEFVFHIYVNAYSEFAKMFCMYSCGWNRFVILKLNKIEK